MSKNRPKPTAHRCATPQCKRITMREQCERCATAALLKRIAARTPA